jgi:hypothetical protein
MYTKKYNTIYMFNKLCAPALIYIVFSISQITIDSLKGNYNIAFVKIFVSILFTILLNHICQRGLGIISWIIVFIPFMLMSLISALLVVMMGLNPSEGDEGNEEKQRELDAREKSILDYHMIKSKDDYVQKYEEIEKAPKKGNNELKYSKAY